MTFIPFGSAATTPSLVVRTSANNDLLSAFWGKQVWFQGMDGDDELRIRANNGFNPTTNPTGARGDWASGGAGNDRIFAFGGDPLLGDGVRVSGDGGNDLIVGSWGNDILNGGADNDQIHGNGGLDELWGGTGADRFFTNVGNNGNPFTNISVVRDYRLSDGDELRIAAGGAGVTSATVANYSIAGRNYGAGLLITVDGASNTGFFVQGASSLSDVNLRVF